MNFTPPNLQSSLLSGRAQQQQVPVTTTSGSTQIASMQKTSNPTSSLQQVSNMVAKIVDDSNKGQVPPPSIQQQIQSAQINNNMGASAQQIINVQHQANVSRNLNLPQQPAFAVSQQQVMSVSSQGNQKAGSLFQHMAFQAQYQQQQQMPLVHSTALAAQQNVFQKFQASIPPQMKPVSVPQTSQQHVKQVVNQLSPSASQNMQYSPSKPVQQHPHPQMKTTAKLASPGSQLQSIQRSPSAAIPHHLIVQPVQSSPVTNKNVPSTTASVTSASSPQLASDHVKSQTSIAVVKLPASSASSTLLQATAPALNSSATAATISPSQPTIKSIANEAKSPTVTTTKAVDQPKELNSSVPPQVKPVPKLSVEEKVATTAPKTMPTLQEAVKKASPAAQEAVAVSASQPVIAPSPSAKAPAASPLASKSTMRLATVTPNRQKKPPATVPSSNKKTPTSPAVTSVSKTPSKAVAKPTETAKPAASPKKVSASPSATLSSPSTPVAQTSSAVSVKTKRSRVKVQHFQSPTPEITLVTKLSTQTANPNKNGNNDDKLTIFYK